MKTLALLSIGAAQLIAASDTCAPSQPTQCHEEVCSCVYCLGPTNEAINAPVNPVTCNGDWVISVAGLYWKTQQDGMAYAVESQVQSNPRENRFDIIDGKYLNPRFDWNWGFKAGVGYNSNCDGWDLGVNWTRYTGSAKSHNEASEDENTTLLPIWSNTDTGSGFFFPIFATDIETKWKLKLNLVDLELGREFWNSQKLALRPHIGLRFANIKQHYHIEHKGGSWSTITLLDGRNNEVDIHNDYKGVGLRGGLDSVWNFGCGWALYGDTALAIIFGRFDVDHNEFNRQSEAPFDKEKVFESTDTFRVSRLIADLDLGVQWSSLICECKYALTVKLGWEAHLFLNQNQMWRVPRTQNGFQAIGSNQFIQSRGDLDTQGWTLSFVFDF